MPLPLVFISGREQQCCRCSGILAIRKNDETTAKSRNFLGNFFFLWSRDFAKFYKVFSLENYGRLLERFGSEPSIQCLLDFSIDSRNTRAKLFIR